LATDLEKQGHKYWQKVQYSTIELVTATKWFVVQTLGQHLLSKPDWNFIWPFRSFSSVEAKKKKT
jgi:hypothetical protein